MTPKGKNASWLNPSRPSSDTKTEHSVSYKGKEVRSGKKKEWEDKIDLRLGIPTEPNGILRDNIGRPRAEVRRSTKSKPKHKACNVERPQEEAEFEPSQALREQLNAEWEQYCHDTSERVRQPASQRPTPGMDSEHKDFDNQHLSLPKEVRKKAEDGKTPSQRPRFTEKAGEAARYMKTDEQPQPSPEGASQTDKDREADGQPPPSTERASKAAKHKENDGQPPSSTEEASQPEGKGDSGQPPRSTEGTSKPAEDKEAGG